MIIAVDEPKPDDTLLKRSSSRGFIEKLIAGRVVGKPWEVMAA
jgi:hypothetical protein